MDITGHFESASCVIEVDGSATLAQVKGKLVEELGVPRARHVGVRMRGGGDIGDDDLRICDTVMDEGCAVELYYTGANITPGVIPRLSDSFAFTLSPCDRYLAVMYREKYEMTIFDTETHESLCSLPCFYTCNPAFSPCSEWIACVNDDTHRAEVHDVRTGALEHSFGDGDVERLATAWSPCGTKLLSCCNKGLQVWDIATGVVHVWDHIVDCLYAMLVAGDKVAMIGSNSTELTVWDYTTGTEVFVFTCPSDVDYLALSPNQCFIAACCTRCVYVWNMETSECVFENTSEDNWAEVAVSNDVVAVYSPGKLCAWSISTKKLLLDREFESNHANGLAISNCGGVVMCGRDDGVELIDISHLS